MTAMDREAGRRSIETKAHIMQLSIGRGKVRNAPDIVIYRTNRIFSQLKQKEAKID